MRAAFLAFAAVLALAATAEARSHHPPTASSSDDAYYTNVSGHRVHRPIRAAARPSGASAQCRDGSYSFSEHHRGTCSHHGGVADWLR
jgi:hypothetical protein